MTLLERVLSRGYVHGNATKIVGDDIKAKQERLLLSKNEDVQRFYISIQHVLDQAGRLKSLSLWVLHANLIMLTSLFLTPENLWHCGLGVGEKAF
jgi:hypothetical protein